MFVIKKTYKAMVKEEGSLCRAKAVVCLTLVVGPFVLAG